MLAEAAACGLPAVAVSAPGCDEVVRDGETGILTKGDPAALAEAAIGLLLDAERRAADGRACPRRSPSASSTSTLQIDRTLAVYAEARRRDEAGRGAGDATTRASRALPRVDWPSARGLLAADPRVRTLCARCS